jgi:hypothetical protein
LNPILQIQANYRIPLRLHILKDKINQQLSVKQVPVKDKDVKKFSLEPASQLFAGPSASGMPTDNIKGYLETGNCPSF